MPPPLRPTVRSLAAEIGVSATTISFALRNSLEVSLATRERVQQLARARGYRANPLVSALYSQVRCRKSLGDHAVIAYVSTWQPTARWETCNTKAGQFRGAAKRATELGFRLEDFSLREPGMTSSRLARIFKARGIRGLLIGPLQNGDAVPDFPWDDFAFATMGYSLRSPAISRSCHAHFRGMHRAMDELIVRGYRRIGYVTSQDTEERVNSLWGAAYRLNQLRLAAAHRIEPLTFADEAESRGLKHWLTDARPDAIITALPNVFELLAESGLRPPDGLGFAHLDLPTHLRAAQVCGIDQLWEIVGAGALELVAGQLYTNTCGIPPHPVTQLVEGVWVDGVTVRNQPSGETGGKRERAVALRG